MNILIKDNKRTRKQHAIVEEDLAKVCPVDGKCFNKSIVKESSIDSAIAKTILARSLIFHIFKLVENQPSKQRLKQKGLIILKNFQTCSRYRKIFIKIHN